MAQGGQWLDSERVSQDRRQFHNVAEMRYVGQNYELQVELPAGKLTQQDLRQMREDFFRAHEMNYGYYNPDAPIQFVNFRSEAIGIVSKPKLAEVEPMRGPLEEAVLSRREVYFQETGMVECPVYDRTKLGMTDRIDGPCIVEQMDSTTVIPPDVWFRVDRHGNLILNTFS